MSVRDTYKTIDRLAVTAFGEYTPEVQLSNREYSLRCLMDKAHDFGFEHSDRLEVASAYWKAYVEYTAQNNKPFSTPEEARAYTINREQHSAREAQKKIMEKIEEWQK